MTNQPNWGGDTTSTSTIPPRPRAPKPSSKPMHPRAFQGALFGSAGVLATLAGFFLYRGLDLEGSTQDDPTWTIVLMVVGGFLALAGVIVYAASPARIDWDPPEVHLTEWRQGKR